MKNGLTITLIIAAFAIGYLVGGHNSETQTDNKLTSSVSADLAKTDLNDESDKMEDSKSGIVQSDNMEQPLKQSSSSEAKIPSISERGKTEEGIASSGQTNVSSDFSPDMHTDFPLAQRELEDWQDRHIEELKSRIHDALGNSGDFMYDKIVSENALLNEMSAETSLEDDIAWRYQAEQAVTDFILTNASDPSVQLLQVVCIQKKCEVTMTGNNQQSAVELYMQITAQKPFDLKEASSPTFYMKDDKSYWLYFVLSFN